MACKHQQANAITAQATACNSSWLMGPKAKVPPASDVLSVLHDHGKGMHLCCLRRQGADVTAPPTIKWVSSWQPVGEGGQGSVLRAQVQDCTLIEQAQGPDQLLRIPLGAAQQRAIKVSLIGQFSWMDAKGVPRVVRKLADEYEALQRTGEGSLHTLQPCSLGMVSFPLEFGTGCVPQHVADAADQEEANAVAAARAFMDTRAADLTFAETMDNMPGGTSQQVCLVFAYVELPWLTKSLFDVLLERPDGVRKEEAMAVLCGCGQGLADFSGARLAHRDVKAQNVLLKLQKWVHDPSTPDLPLFAFVTVLAGPLAFMRTTTDLITRPGRGGTLRFLPPEATNLQTGPYDQRAVDVWEFAVLAIHLRFGWEKMGKWLDNGKMHSAAGPLELEGGRRPAAGSTRAEDAHLLDEEEAEMLQGCLNPDPAQRWTLVQLHQCAYMRRAQAFVCDLKDEQKRAAFIQEWCRRTGYEHRSI